MDESGTFLRGVSVSIYQQSGDDGQSNWTDFFLGKHCLARKPYKALLNKGSDFWHWYEQDIKHCAELGSNAFRLAFEWARLQPHGPNTPLDPEAVQRFHEMINCCWAHGMEPVMVLHHFTHPVWFEKLGAFEKEENLQYFESYCVAVFQEFRSSVRRWATINEPTSYTFGGFMMGSWPPAKFLRASRAGRVLVNLLKAHLRVYRTLKQLPGGQEAQIGLIHHHISFVPRHKLPHVKWLCKWMTRTFGTYAVLEFFQTGHFRWDSPAKSGGPKTLYIDEAVVRGEPVVDWWGINYYTRPAVHWNFKPGASSAHEPCADKFVRLYPQGIYDSIKEAAPLKVPIYITEIGLPDNTDNYRNWYIRAVHAMVLRAIADGYDVRGSFWWTLNDDLEWNGGYIVKMGLYEWHTDYTKKYKDNHNRPPEGLRLKEGSKALPEIYRAWPQSLTELKAYAAQHAWHVVPAYAKPSQDPAVVTAFPGSPAPPKNPRVGNGGPGTQLGVGEHSSAPSTQQNGLQPGSGQHSTVTGAQQNGFADSTGAQQPGSRGGYMTSNGVHTTGMTPQIGSQPMSGVSYPGNASAGGRNTNIVPNFHINGSAAPRVEDPSPSMTTKVVGPSSAATTMAKKLPAYGGIADGHMRPSLLNAVIGHYTQGTAAVAAGHKPADSAVAVSAE